MEVFQTDHYYIFVDRERSLWWNRTNATFAIKSGWDLSSVDDIECIGVTPGILGLITLDGVYESRLVIIKEAVPMGVLYHPHLVYKIKSICLLSDEEPDKVLNPCPRHNNQKKSNENSPAKSAKSRLFESSQLMNKTWGAVKIAGNTIKSTTQQAAALASNQMRSTVGIRDPIRTEKRIGDELHKIFDDSDSFYYCPTDDITNNLQRRMDNKSVNFDDRFFWNKFMLTDIMKLNDNHWITPIIQGFVQMEQCVIGNECFTLALVSRRSRFRAGTRYKRRGIDENGHCANYVETEQILSFRQHQMSFTQVRGSVPVYWSQPGYKYRPPPRIDKGDVETQQAFEKHFNSEIDIYNSICIINLVEQTGKEKVIFDAYSTYVMKYDSDKLIYVSFDFHDYCRGMKFENVSALIEALAPEAGAMGFHWRDSRGTICNQKSVFRVNCMDCLDRTNVVQTAIGKAVLESQLVKLGLAPPYSPIPEPLKSPFMDLWANNGDVISRQYAGTNALKGDYTRTGERKLTGLVKDGMNSANRYIRQHFADTFRQSVIDLMLGHIHHSGDMEEDDALEQIKSIAEIALIPSSLSPPAANTFYACSGPLGKEMQMAEGLLSFASYYLARFKDTYRQATIDLMLGNPISAELFNALGGTAGQHQPDDTDALESAEHARLLVEDCRRLLLGSTQYPIGSWGLIDADPNSGDPNETEVDTILLLTDEFYLVAEYDSHLDKIVRFEKVPLIQIYMIEFGLFQYAKMFQGAATPHLCIRFNYMVNGVDGYFHMFRSPNIRFFNNVAVVIKTQDEVMESLMAIMEFFRITLDNCGKNDVQYLSGGTLQRRKSRTPMLDVPRGIPRNLSESQLLQIGTKALTNVAGQFSKLGQTLNPTKIRTGKKVRNDNEGSAKFYMNPNDGSAKFTVGRDALHPYDTSSDSDDNDSNIYEPDITDLVHENPIYSESFLPSVGIVMTTSTNDTEPDSKATSLSMQLENRGTVAKISEDVSTMSISSVTDHINMPVGMLENASPVRSRSPAPEIFVQHIDMSGTNPPNVSNQKMNQSNSETTLSHQHPEYEPTPRDLSLNLSTSQSDNTLKQLKTLTSPLSKLAKGVTNFGINLDPRKMTVKSPVSNQPSPEEPDESESQRLQEIWDTSKCKTKLIAL